jgi:hypothetical protein
VTLRSWAAVPKVPGSLVVNAGDLLHRWTNGRWKACLHRVACPTMELATIESLSAPPLVHAVGSCDERGSDSEFFSPASPAKTFNAAAFWSKPMMLFDDAPQSPPELDLEPAPSVALPPGGSSGRGEGGGGVDYDALIAAATTDAQRASYAKMKAKADVRYATMACTPTLDRYASERCLCRCAPS